MEGLEKRCETERSDSGKPKEPSPGVSDVPDSPWCGIGPTLDRKSPDALSNSVPLTKPPPFGLLVDRVQEESDVCPHAMTTGHPRDPDYTSLFPAHSVRAQCQAIRWFGISERAVRRGEEVRRETVRRLGGREVGGFRDSERDSETICRLDVDGGIGKKGAGGCGTEAEKVLSTEDTVTKGPSEMLISGTKPEKGKFNLTTALSESDILRA